MAERSPESGPDPTTGGGRGRWDPRRTLRDPRVVIARREWQVLAAEKTIVLALVLQLFIAAFSSFLVVGLVSLYDPASVEGLQVEVGVSGGASDDLVAVAEEMEGLAPRSFETPTAAREAFERGQVDAAVVAENREGRVFVRAMVPDSNVQTTVVVVQLREALQAYERAERRERAGYLSATPLDLPPRPASSPYFGFTYTVLVPLLLFLPVFISGSIAVDSVTEELERGTFELLRVAPVSVVDIVDGKVLAAAALAPAQAVLWMALLELNGTRLGHPVLLTVLVAALALLVVAMAVGVALFAPDRRAAQFLYSVGVLLLFGGSSLVPHGPANAAARLAIESATATTTGVVFGLVVLAVLTFGGVRRLVGSVVLDG